MDLKLPGVLMNLILRVDSNLIQSAIHISITKENAINFFSFENWFTVCKLDHASKS